MTCLYAVNMSEDLMESELLSYKELAVRLGVKLPSARKLVHRKHWGRVTGNDGVVRIHVPIDHFRKREDASCEVAIGTVPPTVPATANDHDPRAAEIEHLEEKIKILNEVVSEARLRAELEARRASDFKDERDYWRNQANRSLWQQLFGKKLKLPFI